MKLTIIAAASVGLSAQAQAQETLRIDFSEPHRLSIDQFAAPKAKMLQLFDANDNVLKSNFKGIRIGLRKGNEALLKRIDTAILDMNKDGTLDRFGKLYFPFTIYPNG